VFEQNFERGELGAACTVVVDGHVVVDVWGGWADADRTRPWGPDTLVNAYSVGKPFAALQLLQLVADGRVELDAEAARWWPDLRAGRAGATVRDVLCHRAGVPAIRRPLTNDDLWDWPTMTEALAETEPWWPPGSRHAYHTNTYGFLVGELARRVTGETPGPWLREHVAVPLGADVAWGLAEADLVRCADVVWEGPQPDGSVDWTTMGARADEVSMIDLGYFNPPGVSGFGVVNTAPWRRAQVPSTNLHATARGVARVYAALAADGRSGDVVVLDRDVLSEATRVASEGWCPVLGRDVSFGLGFQPTRPDRPFGPNAGSFGHFGTGGALGFADPSAGLAFGYVMNAVRPRWQNERNRALVDAVYRCL
jgi:CubicO group peptidase (beta-lactamase class C family)